MNKSIPTEIGSHVAYAYSTCAYHYFRGSDFPVHTHKQWEVVVIMEGDITHIINGNKQTLKKGDLVLIRPTDIHGFEKCTSTSPLQLTAFMEDQAFRRFSDDILPSLYENLLAMPAPFSINLTENELKSLENTLENFTSGEKTYTQTALNRAATKAILTKALELAVKYSDSAPKSAPSYPDWLSAFLVAAAKPENFDKPLKKLIKNTNYCMDYFTKLFRRHTGNTPLKYVNDIKLSYAQKLLTSTDQPILEIAHKLGYATESYFCRIFKTAYGIAPKNFRKISRVSNGYRPYDKI